MRAQRFFVYCYDVVPEFVENFKYLKKDGKDEFRVNYMEAAFDTLVKRGEFFVEFEKPVNDTNVVECFEAQGAKGAQAITFQHNDGGVSAINALASVLTLQDKTGSKASRGSSDLLSKARIKQVEDAKQKELLNRECHEKESAAIQKSLEDVNGNVKGVMDSVQSHKVELESHGAKLDSQGVVMEDIKHGVCDIIPELQAKNANLEKEVAHHILQRDIQEGKTAVQTRKVNEKEAEILALRKREEALLKREEAHLKREEGYLKRIKELEDNLEVSKSLENVKQIAQLALEDRAFLKDELAFARSERAVSRQSAMANDEAEIIEEEEERAAKRPRV